MMLSAVDADRRAEPTARADVMGHGTRLPAAPTASSGMRGQGGTTIQDELDGGDAANNSAPKETSADKRDYPWLPSSTEYPTARPQNLKMGWVDLIVLVPASIPFLGG